MSGGAPTRGGARPSGALRVLVVGNYAGDRQLSMRLFARTLADELGRRGIAVNRTEPPLAFGCLLARHAGLAKFAGYLDKYLLFPAMLRARAGRYDCVHIADHSNAPYLSCTGRTPTVVTCHDLFAVQVMRGEVPGQSFGRLGGLLQRRIARELGRARHLTSVSHRSAEELRRLTGATAPVPVIPNMLPPFFRRLADAEVTATLAADGLDGATPFFLHVGGNQFYKNRPGVVQLFDRLAADPRFAAHRLLLVGKPPDAALAAALAASPSRSRIELVTDASDELVRALYHRAAALLFVSRAEGFGWPILEAQACGCPVVTTDAEPMRGVAGGAAVLIDPADLDGAAARVADGVERAEELIEMGYRNARRYAADEIMPRYLQVYADAREGARC